MSVGERWDIFEKRVQGFELTLPGVALGTRNALVEFRNDEWHVSFEDSGGCWAAHNVNLHAAWMTLLCERLHLSAVITEYAASPLDVGLP